MFHGKMKAVTFSYDDGVTQDIRLIKLFDKYNLRCTFNINSQLAGKSGSLIRKGKKVDHNKINLSDIKEIYKGHEIAVHTLTHPNLTLLKDEEIIWQVEEDKKNLERASGKKIYGMAYPGGGINWNRHVAQVIQAHTSIQYARTTDITDGFGRQKNLFAFRPNAYHVMNMERLFSVGEKFLREEESEEKFYTYGDIATNLISQIHGMNLRDFWSLSAGMKIFFTELTEKYFWTAIRKNMHFPS